MSLSCSALNKDSEPDSRKKGAKRRMQTDTMRREHTKKDILKAGSGWRLLTRAGVGLWHRLTLIVNGRLSLLRQPEPEWSLTALSGSVSGSAAGQELG